MKIKSGFELREVCGEFVIVSHGIENIDFSKIISLNESAAYLWKSLVDKDFTVEDMTTLLTSEYEVTKDVAHADAERMANQWKEIGLVE